MVGEDEEETAQFGVLYKSALSFIGSFKWVGKVEKMWLGLGVADIVGVFLVEIEPTEARIDSVVWVVVGDIPPAYLVIDDAPDPVSALERYIEEMRMWVDEVIAGKPVSQCIPVNGAATVENAQDLSGRLAFLEREILPYHASE